MVFTPKIRKLLIFGVLRRQLGAIFDEVGEQKDSRLDQESEDNRYEPDEAWTVGSP